jgi:hypothetical protein
MLGSQNRRKRKSSLLIAYLCHTTPSATVGVDYFPTAFRRANELGYDLVRVDPSSMPWDKGLLKVLYNRGFVGVIVGSLRAPDHDIILRNALLPVVCCGRIDYLPIHTVQPEITQMVRLAWHKLIDAGYRRIGAGICAHTPPILDDFTRLGAVLSLQSYTLAAKNRVPPFQGAFVDYGALLSWFHQYKPDAVLGFSPGQYYVLRDGGVDMSKIAYVSLHAGLDPKTTDVAGVVENFDSVPRESINLLDQLIRHRNVGLPSEPIRLLMPGHWHEGPTLFPKLGLRKPPKATLPGASVAVD